MSTFLNNPFNSTQQNQPTLPTKTKNEKNIVNAGDVIKYMKQSPVSDVNITINNNFNNNKKVKLILENIDAINIQLENINIINNLYSKYGNIEPEVKNGKRNKNNIAEIIISVVKRHSTILTYKKSFEMKKDTLKTNLQIIITETKETLNNIIKRIQTRHQQNRFLKPRQHR